MQGVPPSRPYAHSPTQIITIPFETRRPTTRNQGPDEARWLGLSLQSAAFHMRNRCFSSFGPLLHLWPGGNPSSPPKNTTTHDSHLPTRQEELGKATLTPLHLLLSARPPTCITAQHLRSYSHGNLNSRHSIYYHFSILSNSSLLISRFTAVIYLLFLFVILRSWLIHGLFLLEPFCFRFWKHPHARIGGFMQNLSLTQFVFLLDHWAESCLSTLFLIHLFCFFLYLFSMDCI